MGNQNIVLFLLRESAGLLTVASPKISVRLIIHMETTINTKKHGKQHKKILLYIQAEEKNANELTIKQFLFSSFSITQTFQNSQVKFHNSIGMGCPSDKHSWERFSKA